MAEIPSDKLYIFKTEVEEIKGINSQSVDDLVNAATELKRNFQAYIRSSLRPLVYIHYKFLQFNF